MIDLFQFIVLIQGGVFNFFSIPTAFFFYSAFLSGFLHISLNMVEVFHSFLHMVEASTTTTGES